MSCTNCPTANTNNTISCPQRMSDGRFCTNYYPKCAMYSQINDMASNGNTNAILSSHDMRQYLQHNAMDVMKFQENLGFRDVVGCLDCKGAKISTMHPERYVVKCNGVSLHVKKLILMD